MVSTKSLTVYQIWDQTRELERAIYTKGDPFEIMLHEALTQFKPVMLTMETGKVYVGFVTRNFNPAFPLTYVSILPAVSGYRQKVTQTVCFDTDYLKLYQDMEKELPTLAGLTSRDFEITFPVSDIRSVRLFDVEIYDEYFAPADGTDLSDESKED